MNFKAIGFAKPIQQAITACGYKTLTPVQEKSIALVRKGRDLLVNAETGTGKTAAFALPILQRMVDKIKALENSENSQLQQPTTLILTPTRELAEQLATTIAQYAQFLDFSIVAVFGGIKIDKQTPKLQAGVDILIATPGRLLEHISLANINLSGIEYLVLDEADRMLDMGFVNDVAKIIAKTGDFKQTLLFSATMTPALNELSHQILKNPIEIRTNKKVNKAAKTIEHVLYAVDEERKISLFMDLLHEYNWFQVLVFTSTKRQADVLLETLKKKKVKAALVHGDKSQGARRRALVDFKSAKLQVLVATEIAARGLDIVGLDFVINYNLPFLAEDYIHRIGRTGRAGNTGTAISFVSPQEFKALARIERIIGEKIKRIYRKGYEIQQSFSSTKSNRTTKSTKSVKSKQKKLKKFKKIKKKK